MSKKHIIVSFIIQKLINKHISLKKYTDWAILGHVTQNLEFPSWTTSFGPNIFVSKLVSNVLKNFCAIPWHQKPYIRWWILWFLQIVWEFLSLRMFWFPVMFWRVPALLESKHNYLLSNMYILIVCIFIFFSLHLQVQFWLSWKWLLQEGISSGSEASCWRV